MRSLLVIFLTVLSLAGVVALPTQGDEKPHWSFVKPKRPPVPQVQTSGTPGVHARNEIDAFILDRLKRAGLSMTAQADRETLLRRVSLDLTGLPPTLEEAEAFLADASPDAYERLVDRTLASPHYGEKLAQDWLDLARFGDTGGYQDDAQRPAHPYRDQVIVAFNANQPFDQFTIEQLAGDLLPQPTLAQRVASGFNRLHRHNEEGGSDPDEFRVVYVVDRTNTVGTVWLGLTVGCAQCHDHKYDPLSQREYYELYAFFNNLKGETPVSKDAHPPPFVRVPTLLDQSRLERLTIQRRELEARKSASGVSEPDKKRIDEELAAVDAEHKAIDDRSPKTPVFEELEKRRPSFVLDAGDFERPKEEVQPGVPALFPLLPDGAAANRLTLARWLVSPDHPLTARVTANRLWKQLFGVGLVKTADDFGTQGEPPSHPELLDWLAVQLIEDGWDVKKFLRRIMLSATYRQSSRASRSAYLADPENRLLARGSRFRLTAEEIRDGALTAGGLLNHRVGGPSVFPYQPAGFFGDKSSDWSWPDASDDSLYRRGIYTFWRRTTMYPSFQVFDAPPRGECTVSRPRTNTPLQALVTLNDPVFVEAARVFGQRIMEQGGPTPAERVAFAFRAALVRRPTAAESAALLRLFEGRLARYRADIPAAQTTVAAGKSPRPGQLDAAELAAWTSVAATLLNLDEFVTRE